MLQRLRAWLAKLTFTDPIAQQQAPFIQFYLLGSLVVWPLFLPMVVLGEPQRALALTILVVGLGLIALTAAALVLLRRGRFYPAVALSIASIINSSAVVLASVGLRNSGPQPLIFVVPVMLAGLMLGRRHLVITIAACIGVVCGVGVAETLQLPIIGYAAKPLRAADVAGVFVLALLIIGFLLDRAGGALRRALVTATDRERDLQAIRAAQERTIAERTAALEAALRGVTEREVALQQTLIELKASELTIRELSAPVLPVLPGVLIAPLVGALDSERAAIVTTNILHAVERAQARLLILEITGVPAVDVDVAQLLLETAAAVRLLGAEVQLVGIRPDVASTMVALGIQLHKLATFPNLEAALAALLGPSGMPPTLLRRTRAHAA